MKGVPDRIFLTGLTDEQDDRVRIPLLEEDGVTPNDNAHAIVQVLGMMGISIPNVMRGTGLERIGGH